MKYPKRLQQVIENKGGNYILPFLWMHGEGKEILKEEMDRIEECGIREICLESRPHPDFAGSVWWEELDFIMEEARSRNMRIWILDDDKFPTGHANGAYEDHPELAKVYLAERHMDVIGPVNDSAVLIEPFLGSDGELLAVLACPKPETHNLNISGDGILDLTDQVCEGMVYFDIPEGFYRIFVLYTTRKNGGRENYMNLIDKNSVRILIDSVYEPHYKRYQKDFGKTFAGFFSDEPELGNTPGYDFQDKLGKKDVKLPWSKELQSMLKERWGTDYVKNLPALWYDSKEKTSGVRSDYMECVTKLVSTCFSGQIGEWCRQRGIQYIGHIIEDDNAHGRLGCSIGHYFRAQKGQDMSGIDVVLLQIMPGFTETYHQWIASDRDGEFFHYGLAKLGSSYAHIDPAKAGRALCEIYGAYGWGEGISLMKWLTDHMLVRGINTFVPHAFSPMFPDKDCPPHFHARGNNPQYRFFTLLMKYMNRMSHLLNGGTHKADAAILYHAEAEWTGKETMLFQKPVRELLEHQMDCDIIPADILTSIPNSGHIKLKDGKMNINGVTYTSFVIPYCEHLPKNVENFVIQAAKSGLPIYIIDKMPQSDTQGNKISEQFISSATLVSLNNLSKKVSETAEPVFQFEKTYKNLRASCYRQQEGNIYMFFNESPFETVETKVTFTEETTQSLIRYNGINNNCSLAEMKNNTLNLHLMPGESKVYISCAQTPDSFVHILDPVDESDSLPLSIDWEISISDPSSYPVFEKKMTIKAGNKLPNMNGKNGFPRFTGTFAYEGTFKLDIAICKVYLLQLPSVGDCAEIWVNENYAGMVIGNPYTVDVTPYIKEGENKLRIEVTNTLVWKMHDGQSTHMQLNATGLLKQPVLHIYQ